MLTNIITNSNPLEQFSVYSTTPALVGIANIISLTNIAIVLILGLIVLIIFMISATSNSIKPSRWFIVLETWIASILGIVRDQIGDDPKRSLIYFPLMFSLFSFILLSNFLGMVPYSFTPTSHISVTMGFSIAIWIGATIVGFENHKTNFFSLLVPSGTPIGLVPLLVLIEFISYTARAFSLALRLTANVSAGHCLFGVISMLSCSASQAISNIILKGLTVTLPLLILVPLYGLELLVALLQSYVFTLLTLSYLKDGLTLGGH